MQIEKLTPALAELCEIQFSKIGWTKPEGHFRAYYQQQLAGEIACYVAHEPNQYIGHIKLVWQADYPHFRDAGIPESQDLNVMPDYRNQGIGTALMGPKPTFVSPRAINL